MNIEKYTHIKRSELDEGDYFESLIVKAYELGFVTQTDVESIQDACFELLAQNLRRTYGDTVIDILALDVSIRAPLLRRSERNR